MNTAIKVNKGFSLLEVLGVLAITAILIGIAAGPTLSLIERARQDAEVRILQRMANDIESSFQNSDLNNVNISALPGEVENADWSTTFDTPQIATFPAALYDTDGFPVVNTPTRNQWWFVKLARQRGVPLGDATANWTKAANPALYDLITNVYYRPRILVAEPNSNMNSNGYTSQRYMLISLMAPTHRVLPIPGPGGTDDASIRAWFDSIWNNNFDQGTAPAGWDAAWSQNNNAQKLKVVRISQPRYQLTINNTSKTDGGYVYYNGRTLNNATVITSSFHRANADIYYDSTSSSVISHDSNLGTIGTNPLKIPTLDGSNVWQRPGILAGRRIIIMRGATATATTVDPASVFDFNINETTTITIQ